MTEEEKIKAFYKEWSKNIDTKKLSESLINRLCNNWLVIRTNNSEK